MKKLGKFICVAATVLLFVAFAYYFVKNIVNKDSTEEPDSYDDDFDAFETEEKKELFKAVNSIPKKRSYVTLNMETDAE